MVAINPEQWRPVKGFAHIYEVSDRGRVRRILRGRGAVVGRILKTTCDSGGYPTVAVCDDGRPGRKSVHVLVAEAFISDRPEDMQVNHIDGNKTNNRRENLEWMTRRENMAHAKHHGLLPTPRATRQVLTDNQVREIRKLALDRVPHRVVAERYGVVLLTIASIVSRRSRKNVV